MTIGHPSVPLGNTDGAMQAAIINWLVQRIESGKLAELLAAGVPADALDRIRHVGTRLTARVATVKCASFISIAIDINGLHATLNSLEQSDSYQEQIGFFVENGATNPMLRQLFGLPREEAARYREMLLGESSRTGRVPLPAVKDREEIYSLWKCLALKVTDRRARYIALHEALRAAQPLGALYAIVNEYESR